MKPADVPYRRLQSLQLTDNTCTDVSELVRWLGAVQAQDYVSSKWALGVRLPDITDKDIEQAFAQRRIVRTWPMRGTLHIVPAKDAKWMLKLMASRTISGAKARRRNLELTDEQLAESAKIITAALKGGKSMTRKELLEVIEAGGVSVANQRAYHILAHNSWSGLICLGPMDGKQQTFVLLNEWVPDSIELSREQALTEIVVRYAQSHGPVTQQDIMRWTGLPATDIKQGLAGADNRLQAAEIADVRHWMQPTAPSLSKQLHEAFLLPAFDEFVIGYKDRSAVLHNDHENKVVPGNNGVFLPLIVIDGQVVGTWKRAVGKQIKIECRCFAEPTASQKQAIAAAAHKFAAFVGVALGKLEWTKLHY